MICALEISKALKSHPELRVRMGIHSGPVNEVSDLNEQANVAGAGISSGGMILVLSAGVPASKLQLLDRVHEDKPF